MKKLFLPFILLGMAMASCQKEEVPQAPEQAETSALELTSCPTCGLRSCTNRSHDICPTCLVSRRPPAGCVCISGGGSGPVDPTTRYMVTPHSFIVEDNAPSYVSVLVIQGDQQHYFDMDWDFIEHNIDFNRYRVTLGRPGMVIERIPGVYPGGSSCYANFYKDPRKRGEDWIGSIEF